MEDDGHKVVHIQAFHCHVNGIELVLCQTNIGGKGCGLEGVK
jgi:hypothetical protein